jgi:phytoene dehydrogenase-like protein
VALLFTQYTPYRLPNGQQIEITNEYKENYYRNVINSIEEYAPGFEKLIIGRDMLFPSDLEEQFSLTGKHFHSIFSFQIFFQNTGGNIFHGALPLDQLYSFRPAISCSNHRTPIHGLYLCGSSNHPGGKKIIRLKSAMFSFLLIIGGVTGMPGFNAAMIMIDDWRRKKISFK